MQQTNTKNETLRRLYFTAVLFGLILFIWTSGPGFDTREEQAEAWGTAQVLTDGWEIVTETGDVRPIQLPYRPTTREDEPVILRRTMDESRDAGMGMCFYTVYSSADVWLNEQQVYHFGSSEKPFGRGEPENWNLVKLPAIQKGDILTLKISSPYENMPRLIRSVWVGDPVDLMEYLIDRYLGQTVACLLFLITGIAMMLTAFLMKRMQQDVCTLGCLGLFVVMVSVWMISGIPLPWPFRRSTYAVVVLQEISRMLCPIAYLLYFEQRTAARYRPLVRRLGYVFLINFVIQTGIQLAGICDYIEMNIINQVLLGIMGCVLAGIMIHWYRKDKPRSLAFCGGSLGMVVLLFSIFMEIWLYYRNNVESGGNFLRVGLLIYLCIQTLILMRGIHDRYEASERMGTELEQARMQLMISQIKPHFIYNTLSSIRTLIKVDADRAYELVYDFSKYLRANIDSIGREDRIPFSKELEHIRAYCAIEKVRFGERLNVQFQIEDEDFFVPALVVQPLVENAVKHGVCKRPEGGTVLIRSGKQDGYHKIEVIDDGVGFMTEEERGTGSSGIDNIRFRLERVSHATLKLTSIPQKGTSAVIQIPIENEKTGREITDENHNR